MEYKIVVIGGLLLLLFNISCKEINDEDLNNYSSKIILHEHAVPDTLTAVKIAEIILIRRYGESIKKQLPFKVRLEKNIDTLWHIEGSPNIIKSQKLLSFGGIAYISIRSRDCKIIKLYHSD